MTLSLFDLVLLHNWLLWPLCFFPITYALLALGVTLVPKARPGFLADAVPRLEIAATGAAAAFLLIYVFVILGYLFSYKFYDHVEPHLASLAWAFAQGKPLYQDLATQERYSAVYGPDLYILVSTFERALGPTVLSAKVPGALAGLCSIILIYLVVRRTVGWREALGFTGLACILLLAFLHGAFALRNDAILLFLVSFSLYLATARNSLAPLGIGLCLGIAENLKIQGLLYFIPIYGWMLGTGYWSIRGYALSFLATMAVLVMPYLVYANVSFSGFCAFLRMNVGTTDLATFLMSLECYVMLLLPFLLLRHHGALRGREAVAEDRLAANIQLGLLAFAGACLLVPASRSGAGPYHYMPLIPIIIYQFSQFDLQPPWPLEGCRLIFAGLAASSLVACGLSSIIQLRDELQVVRFHGPDDGRAMDYTRDINGIVANNPGWTIMMAGCDDRDYSASYYRYLLVFRGMPIGVDPVVLMDFRRAHLPEVDFNLLTRQMEATYRRPVMWVCAKDDPPFMTRYYYGHSDQDLLYPRAFREDFRREYTKLKSSRYYDLYVPFSGTRLLSQNKPPDTSAAP